MQMHTLETQMQLFFHYLLKQGYLDSQQDDIVAETELSLRRQIQTAQQTPRFDQQHSPVVDQWDIVGISISRYTGDVPTAFEFIFELHYHYTTLQLLALRVRLPGQPVTYFPLPHLCKLPPVSQLIESCKFPTRKTAMGLNDRRYRSCIKPVADVRS